MTSKQRAIVASIQAARVCGEAVERLIALNAIDAAVRTAMDAWREARTALAYLDEVAP